MKKTRIQKYYSSVIAEDFLLLYNHQSVMQLPFVRQAILSTTSKNFLLNRQNILHAFAACFLLAGQRCKPTRARRSLAKFQLRRSSLIGCMITLHRSKMYALFDKIIACVLPRLQSQSARLAYSKSSLCSTLPLNHNVSFHAFSEEKVFDKKMLSRAELRSVNIETALARAKQSFALKSLAAQINLQFGIKQGMLFPEIENLFEIINAAQGFNVLFSLSLPRTKLRLVTKLKVKTSKQEHKANTNRASFCSGARVRTQQNLEAMLEAKEQSETLLDGEQSFALLEHEHSKAMLKAMLCKTRSRYNQATLGSPNTSSATVMAKQEQDNILYKSLLNDQKLFLYYNTKAKREKGLVFLSAFQYAFVRST